MVRDISQGYILVNVRTFTRLSKGQLDQLGFELERRVREVRSEQTGLEDTAAIQEKQRRLGRLTSARTMFQSHRRRRKI